MELTVEKVNELVNQIQISTLSDDTKDLLWCVTRIRTNAYLLIYNMGLCYAKSDPVPFNVIEHFFKDMWINFLTIAAQYPEEIKYNDEKKETPRLDTIKTVTDTFAGLNSDGDIDGSIRELARIVATNEDSNHEHLNYAILVGIMSRIIAWRYPDIDILTILNNKNGD